MAEDTWALNEGVIDEDAFLDQAWYLTLAEREAMFRNALEQTRRGVVACVFDTSDRVQHMFYRHLDGSGDPHWQRRDRRALPAHGPSGGEGHGARWRRTPCCSCSPITASAPSAAA